MGVCVEDDVSSFGSRYEAFTAEQATGVMTVNLPALHKVSMEATACEGVVPEASLRSEDNLNFSTDSTPKRSALAGLAGSLSCSPDATSPSELPIAFNKQPSELITPLLRRSPPHPPNLPHLFVNERASLAKSDEETYPALPAAMYVSNLATYLVANSGLSASSKKKLSNLAGDTPSNSAHTLHIASEQPSPPHDYRLQASLIDGNKASSFNNLAPFEHSSNEVFPKNLIESRISELNSGQASHISSFTSTHTSSRIIPYNLRDSASSSPVASLETNCGGFFVSPLESEQWVIKINSTANEAGNSTLAHQREYGCTDELMTNSSSMMKREAGGGGFAALLGKEMPKTDSAPFMLEDYAFAALIEEREGLFYEVSKGYHQQLNTHFSGVEEEGDISTQGWGREGSKHHDSIGASLVMNLGDRDNILHYTASSSLLSSMPSSSSAPSARRPPSPHATLEGLSPLKSPVLNRINDRGHTHTLPVNWVGEKDLRHPLGFPISAVGAEHCGSSPESSPTSFRQSAGPSVCATSSTSVGMVGIASTQQNHHHHSPLSVCSTPQRVRKGSLLTNDSVDCVYHPLPNGLLGSRGGTSTQTGGGVRMGEDSAGYHQSSNTDHHNTHHPAALCCYYSSRMSVSPASSKSIATNGSLEKLIFSIEGNNGSIVASSVHSRDSEDVCSSEERTPPTPLSCVQHWDSVDRAAKESLASFRAQTHIHDGCFEYSSEEECTHTPGYMHKNIHHHQPLFGGSPHHAAAAVYDIGLNVSTPTASVKQLMWHQHESPSLDNCGSNRRLEGTLTPHLLVGSCSRGQATTTDTSSLASWGSPKKFEGDIDVLYSGGSFEDSFNTQNCVDGLVPMGKIPSEIVFWQHSLNGLNDVLSPLRLPPLPENEGSSSSLPVADEAFYENGILPNYYHHHPRHHQNDEGCNYSVVGHHFAGIPLWSFNEDQRRSMEVDSLSSHRVEEKGGGGGGCHLMGGLTVETFACQSTEISKPTHKEASKGRRGDVKSRGSAKKVLPARKNRGLRGGKKLGKTKRGVEEKGESSLPSKGIFADTAKPLSKQEKAADEANTLSKGLICSVSSCKSESSRLLEKDLGLSKEFVAMCADNATMDGVVALPYHKSVLGFFPELTDKMEVFSSPREVGWQVNDLLNLQSFYPRESNPVQLINSPTKASNLATGEWVWSSIPASSSSNTLLCEGGGMQSYYDDSTSRGVPFDSLNGLKNKPSLKQDEGIWQPHIALHSASLQSNMKKGDSSSMESKEVAVNTHQSIKRRVAVKKPSVSRSCKRSNTKAAPKRSSPNASYPLGGKNKLRKSEAEEERAQPSHSDCSPSSSVAKSSMGGLKSAEMGRQRSAESARNRKDSSKNCNLLVSAEFTASNLGHLRGFEQRSADDELVSFYIADANDATVLGNGMCASFTVSRGNVNERDPLCESPTCVSCSAAHVNEKCSISNSSMCASHSISHIECAQKPTLSEHGNHHLKETHLKASSSVSLLAGVSPAAISIECVNPHASLPNYMNVQSSHDGLLYSIYPSKADSGAVEAFVEVAAHRANSASSSFPSKGFQQVANSFDIGLNSVYPCKDIHQSSSCAYGDAREEHYDEMISSIQEAKWEASRTPSMRVNTLDLYPPLDIDSERIVKMSKNAANNGGFPLPDVCDKQPDKHYEVLRDESREDQYHHAVQIALFDSLEDQQQHHPLPIASFDSLEDQQQHHPMLETSFHAPLALKPPKQAREIQGDGKEGVRPSFASSSTRERRCKKRSCVSPTGRSTIGKVAKRTESAAPSPVLEKNQEMSVNVGMWRDSLADHHFSSSNGLQTYKTSQISPAVGKSPVSAKCRSSLETCTTGLNEEQSAASLVVQAGPNAWKNLPLGNTVAYLSQQCSDSSPLSSLNVVADAKQSLQKPKFGAKNARSQQSHGNAKQIAKSCGSLPNPLPAVKSFTPPETSWERLHNYCSESSSCWQQSSDLISPQKRNEMSDVSSFLCEPNGVCGMKGEEASKTISTKRSLKEKKVARAPNEARTSVKGIYFDSRKNLWRVQWCDKLKGKRISKSFPVMKSNFLKAKALSVAWLLSGGKVGNGDAVEEQKILEDNLFKDPEIFLTAIEEFYVNFDVGKPKGTKRFSSRSLCSRDMSIEEMIQVVGILN